MTLLTKYTKNTYYCATSKDDSPLHYIQVKYVALPLS